VLDAITIYRSKPTGRESDPKYCGEYKKALKKLRASLKVDKEILERVAPEKK